MKQYLFLVAPVAVMAKEFTPPRIDQRLILGRPIPHNPQIESPDEPAELPTTQAEAIRERMARIRVVLAQANLPQNTDNISRQ